MSERQQPGRLLRHGGPIPKPGSYVCFLFPQLATQRYGQHRLLGRRSALFVPSTPYMEEPRCLVVFTTNGVEGAGHDSCSIVHELERATRPRSFSFQPIPMPRELTRLAFQVRELEFVVSASCPPVFAPLFLPCPTPSRVPLQCKCQINICLGMYSTPSYDGNSTLRLLFTLFTP